MNSRLSLATVANPNPNPNLPDAQAGGAALFDRYRPAAMVVLGRGRPFEQLLEDKVFRSLLLWALPDFIGDTTDALATLDEDYLQAAVRAAQPVEPGRLHAEFPALPQLAARLGLTDAESLILAFLAQAQCDPFWESWQAGFVPNTRRRNATTLARVLGLESGIVQRALEPNGKLVGSPLFERRFIVRQARMLDHFALAPELDAETLRCDSAWRDFLRLRFDLTAPRDPGLDFSYLAADLGVIQDCLHGALRTGARGVHVLLHGPPGTGKTSLAYELAWRLRSELVAVRKAFVAEGETDGEARLRHYNLGQRFGGSGMRSLMLFDELEDLLPESRPGERRGRAHKGWICHALETAATPTLWTTNTIRGIDPAMLRRFSMVLEVGPPPPRFRASLLRASLSRHGITADWCRRVARVDGLTPDMIVQLRHLASSLDLRGAELAAVLERWLQARLAAMGRGPLPKFDATTRFRAELLNMDTSPEPLIKGLAQVGEGRLCLHGPPGTGKTAFAHHLAERLDRPALLRRGSDLRSAYVGETERNVAQMFAQATRDGAVLILDEADTFLSDRARRLQRWEMNETSEFLVQLESYRGIFCATTNRFEDLDPAFMRRFDLKVRFGYLDTAQRERAMRDALRTLGCAPRLSRRSQGLLAQLTELTPGDFAVVLRKLRLSGETVSQASLCSALAGEVACKTPQSARPMGFR